MRDIPVVVLTTSDVERDIVISYHLGAAGYVTKPVDINQFMDELKDLLDRQKQEKVKGGAPWTGKFDAATTQMRAELLTRAILEKVTVTGGAVIAAAPAE